MAHPEQQWLVSIVENDDAVRSAMSRLMRASGFAVKAYATPESFLKAAQPQRQACVLMDITTPFMSGLQLQRRFKETGIDVPVIAVSTSDDENARWTARMLGARFFLRKPVDGQALLDAIRWITGAEV